MRWASKSLERAWQIAWIASAVAALAWSYSGLYGLWSRCRPTQCPTTDESDIAVIRVTIEAFLRDRGRHPRELSELTTPGPDGRIYLPCDTPVPLDPWGNPYVYRPPTATEEYLVETRGPEGQRRSDARTRHRFTPR